MKLVVIGPVPPYRGGISHFTSGLVTELKGRGHEVVTISYRTQYPKLLYPGKSEKDLSQTPFDANFLFSSYNFYDWRTTYKEILALDPELVIYPWWVSVWAPATSWLIRKLRTSGVQVRVLVHNTFPHEGRKLDKALTSWALRNANSFVTMTEKESLRLKSVVSDQVKIHIAPHPIYRPYQLSGMSKPEIRAELGLPHDKPIALFFGFVRPYKGLRILIESLAFLKKKNIKLLAVVAGEFWEDRKDYEEQIKSLGVEDMLVIRDEYIPDNQAGLYFEMADLFVAPYLDGTQSGSIKQAMSYGLPLVVSSAIVDPLIIANPTGCEIIPIANPKAFAVGIERTISRKERSKPAKEYFQASWSNLIDALITSPTKEASE